MLTLGLAGGFNSPHKNQYSFPWFFHDSAAVLVRDAEIVGAIEEERLNRLKHTTCFPVQAIREVLAREHATLRDVDRIGFYFTEEFINTALQFYHFRNPTLGSYRPLMQLVAQGIEQHFGIDVTPKLTFVNHHLAHAASALYPSGYASSLVVTMDGLGDNVSLTVFDGRDGELTVLDSFGPSESLGMFYLQGTEYLGYKVFDEYKVMGLAPYGNPERYRATIRQFYTLLPNGRYTLHRERAASALAALGPARQRGEPFTQFHQDIAAALQEALETLVLHVITHWQRVTGHRRLCLAGGVAHNCSINGKLLYANLFESVFVQPAAHDAGCALGAALLLEAQATGRKPRTPLHHVYLGKEIGDGNEVKAKLDAWKPWIDIQRPTNLHDIVAERLAQGEVAGWVQGRSEFGPRALGNRSILADPRPAKHKDTVNLMVKMREAYRPFAPAVLEEDVDRICIMPKTQARLDFMTYVLQVQPEMRDVLGAVTHVDGSARVQTVSQTANPDFWALISAFKKQTGIPVLLNTSFNNHVEPIVDSVDDAVTCFLTTGIDFLVVGPFLIERVAANPPRLASMSWRLPTHVVHDTHASANSLSQVFTQKRVDLSLAAAACLRLGEAVADVDDAGLERELRHLWSERLIAPTLLAEAVRTKNPEQAAQLANDLRSIEEGLISGQ
jgi:carbamoyltransferase